MSYLGSWKIDDLLTFYANTTRFDTGAATDADAVPAYRVYEDETGTAILTGNMALLDSTNTAGFYSEQITLSAANGFEKGKSYAVYISATVNSVAGATHHTLQIEAEVDANTVSGTVANVTLVATTTTLTNDPSGVTTLLSRLSSARAGYLDNLSAGAVALETTAQSILSKMLKYVQLMVRKDAAIATDNATELTAINANGGSGAGAYVSTTDSLEAQRDNIGTTGAALSNVSSNTVQWNGTAVATPDTAGHPKVTVKSGTGTGEISLSSGVALADLTRILGQSLSESAPGRLGINWATVYDNAGVFTSLTADTISTLTQANVRTAVGLASANLDTQLDALPTAIENADALLNRDMSTGTDSGTATVRTVRQALRFLRNKWAVSGTTLTVYKEDDTTASWTGTVTTNASADPITANDPASS